MNPYAELANAIVLCAVKDYRKALRRLRMFPHDDSAVSYTHLTLPTMAVV